MIVLYDENNEVIGEVEYNNKLDYWDGRNYVNGGVGLHKGFGQLKDNRFYMIHGTQWQGQFDNAKICDPKEIVKEAIRTGNTNELDKFPKLKSIYENDFIHE